MSIQIKLDFPSVQVRFIYSNIDFPTVQVRFIHSNIDFPTVQVRFIKKYWLPYSVKIVILYLNAH